MVELSEELDELLSVLVSFETRCLELGEDLVVVELGLLLLRTELGEVLGYEVPLPRKWGPAKGDDGVDGD